MLIADGNRDADDPEVDGRAATEGRPRDVERGANLQGKCELRAEDVEGIGHADHDAQVDLVIERLPLDEEVGVGIEPGLEASDLKEDFQAAARHHGMRRQREVAFTLDRERRADGPIDAQARCWVLTWPDGSGNCSRQRNRSRRRVRRRTRRRTQSRRSGGSSCRAARNRRSRPRPP